MDIFTLDYLATLLLLACRRFYSNHGCLSNDVEADFDVDFFIFQAWLQDYDFEGTLLDIFLDTVLIGVSEDTLLLFVASFYLVVRNTCNPKQKYLRLGISWQFHIEKVIQELKLKF